MAFFTRQPFAEIGSPRLQTLSSAKNRQNAILPSFSSPLKQTTPSTGKRRAVSVFEEEDAENVDPPVFNSPSKKPRTNAGYIKPANYTLLTSPSKPRSTIATPVIPSVRETISSPRTSASTPIGHSRGSPKHKRIGLLSKRRASSSPFRRVDPPSFSQSSPALPFSIDAALSGTIPNYTPKSTVATPPPASTTDESMPNSWFFDIHEDTPEQEAANMMEHSAAVLDISSDDDLDTKRRNEEQERGKENIPPPDFLPLQALARARSVDGMENAGEEPAIEHVKLPRLRKIAQDAMDEDRRPLGDLPAAEFYGEGLDATSYVTVDFQIEKPSSLSKEFDFNCPTPEKECVVKEEPVEAAAEEPIPIFTDEHVESQPSVLVGGSCVVAPQDPIIDQTAETPMVPAEAISEPHNALLLGNP
ncbi:hypothetical protein P154DRAFT_363847 [Amniculicola lignicola CBS 123094]|uniref:Uncharacterized protein n=1 Tax=Amniculicola lignicola CBS 123094 TaxID=1392246 RepID=A0A6A5W1J3_9PLEO|nr:hypothetical protein P154DRAFT_363847 [Amniculicola lignicola CBS 123094]